MFLHQLVENCLLGTPPFVRCAAASWCDLNHLACVLLHGSYDSDRKRTYKKHA